jgi:hypothetical protein
MAMAGLMTQANTSVAAKDVYLVGTHAADAAIPHVEAA